MLRHRLVFGSCMIALLLAVFYLDDQLDGVRVTSDLAQTLLLGRQTLPEGLLIFAVCLVLIALGTGELAAVFKAKGGVVDRLMLTVGAVTGCGLAYAMPEGLGGRTASAVYATGLAVVFLVAMFRQGGPGRIEGVVAATGAVVFATVYLGCLPGFLIAIRLGYGSWVLAGVVLVTKSCDIGAYFTGRAIGRHKLVPWLSPGKTWEGLAGGLITSAVVTVVLVLLADLIDGVENFRGFGFHGPGVDRRLWGWAAAGVVVGLFGQVGDLTASLLKRDAGIKDSGHTIPGFGGVLDVCDSPLVVAPVAYWLLRWLSSQG